jgi:hypothetical protein
MHDYPHLQGFGLKETTSIFPVLTFKLLLHKKQKDKFGLHDLFQVWRNCVNGW